MFDIVETAYELWDFYGRPKLEHSNCPICKENDEVGSLFDHMWCCSCGWHGSLLTIKLSGGSIPTTDNAL